MNLDADRVAELAARPLSELTRRDVALALLTVPSADALGSLPAIRRGMLAAGNPLSALFWSSSEAVLQKINDSDATVGDVRTWLEATGTEPNGIIGLHVWDEQSERSQLAAEMGIPSSTRAVARACATNRVSVLVPCHRVVGVSGSLTGYRWGVERKRELLAAERR